VPGLSRAGRPVAWYFTHQTCPGVPFLDFCLYEAPIGDSFLPPPVRVRYWARLVRAALSSSGSRCVDVLPTARCSSSAVHRRSMPRTLYGVKASLRSLLPSGLPDIDETVELQFVEE